MARRGRPRKDGIEGDQTDLHIIMQLRNCIDLGEWRVTFRNGDIVNINAQKANEVCEHYNTMNMNERFSYQHQISESFEKFKNITEKGNGPMG